MNSFFNHTSASARRTWREHALGATLTAVLSLGLFSSQAQADQPGNTRQFGSFDMEGVAAWFRSRFSEAELQDYRPEDFRIESQMCNCSDRPEPHYPYIMVFFSTPKGDLVGRPDRKGFETVITRLAVRYGEEYCNVESEDECYGSFSHPCEFSDFRYGAQLAPYFPTCKLIEPAPSPDGEPGSGLTPVRHRFFPRR